MYAVNVVDMLGLSVKEVAKATLQGIIGYLNDHAESCLERVDVVIPHRSMVKDFVHYLNNAFKKKGAWWHKIPGVQWFVQPGRDFPRRLGEESTVCEDHQLGSSGKK